jgi:hypothetical protein
VDVLFLIRPLTELILIKLRDIVAAPAALEHRMLVAVGRDKVVAGGRSEGAGRIETDPGQSAPSRMLTQCTCIQNPVQGSVMVHVNGSNVGQAKVNPFFMD